MKYTVNIKSKADVALLANNLQNTELFKNWMPGLSEYNVLEGESNSEGCLIELVFSGSKGRTMRMVERVVSMDLPNEVVTTYETDGVYNQCRNRFYTLGEHTIYELETVFKFGFLTSLYMWIFKSTFRKQSLAGMIAYRNFIEDKMEV